MRILMLGGESSLKRPEGFQPTGGCIQTPTYPGSPYRMLYPHPYLIEAGVSDPGTELHELTTGLAGRSPSFMGHDACDNWSAVKKIIAAAGLDPETWGICPHCKGDAIDPEVVAAYNAWTETEPPEGEGYQLWETTSEGSPISPVFSTPEALADWCTENASIFGGEKASRETWWRMITGENSLEAGSMGLIAPGYIGAAANYSGD
ncbi:MAG: hypothetical protein ACO1SX_22230 [Actinomycetota bacterium]